MALVARIEVQGEDVDRVLDRLLGAGADQIEVDHGVALGLFHRADPEALRETLGAALDGLDLAPPTISPAQLLDWGSVWAPVPRPFRVGPLVIAPGGEPGAGRLALELGAFGSGLHPSTRLCLDRLVAYRPRGAVLDVGTGNGILALAALQLGAERAVGVDTDPTAILVARRNAARNGLGDRFALTGDGLASLGERFDRIVANLLAAPLVAMADAIGWCLASGGELSLAGFTVGQADDVAAAFVRLGLRRVGGADDSGWARIDLAAGW